MREADVLDAFCRYLYAHGWTTTTSAREVDVYATRGPERLYAEAKGTTAATGLDVDTAYGQLLRRMGEDDPGDPAPLYVLVVPAHAERAALRVASRIRQLLGIKVFVA